MAYPIFSILKNKTSSCNLKKYSQKKTTHENEKILSYVKENNNLVGSLFNHRPMLALPIRTSRASLLVTWKLLQRNAWKKKLACVEYFWLLFDYWNLLRYWCKYITIIRSQSRYQNFEFSSKIIQISEKFQNYIKIF